MAGQPTPWRLRRLWELPGGWRRWSPAPRWFPPRLHVGGNGPCNGLCARHDATPEGAFFIDSLMATRIGCAGERDALAAAYFDRLNATNAWSLRADSLLLQTADVRWLLFVRQWRSVRCAYELPAVGDRWPVRVAGWPRHNLT